MSDDVQAQASSEQQPPAKPEKELPYLLQDYRRVLATPNVFFETLDYEGGLKDPALFHLSVSVVNALGTFLAASFKPSALAEGFAWAYIGGFVVAGAFHLISKLFQGEGTFQQMYRGIAYAMAPGIFMWIPLCLIFSYLYMFWLFRKVLIKVENLSELRANTVLGIFVIVLALCGIVSVGYTLTKMFKATPVEP